MYLLKCSPDTGLAHSSSQPFACILRHCLPQCLHLLLTPWTQVWGHAGHRAQVWGTLTQVWGQPGHRALVWGHPGPTYSCAWHRLTCCKFVICSSALIPLHAHGQVLSATFHAYIQQRLSSGRAVRQHSRSTTGTANMTTCLLPLTQKRHQSLYKATFFF